MQIDHGNLDAYARGCGLLGGGGGGETRTGVLMAHEAIREYGPIRVVDLDDLGDGQLVMPCGLLGAPTVSLEKVPALTEGDRLVTEIERLSAGTVAALMCMELGGSNGIFPLVWAARRRLPAVDADGTGRAFPQLIQMTMSIAGVPVAPAVLTDERDQVVTLGGDMSAARAERLARSIAVVFGGRACVALFTMTAARARTATVRGTVTRALGLGQAIADHPEDPFGALQETQGAQLLVRAKVVDVARVTHGGFVRGSTVLQGTGGDRGRMVRVEFQNENLVAIEDGSIVATTPAIICILDETTAEAVATEELHYGQRVAVLMLPCDDFWYTTEGLEVAGPRAFGYDVDVVMPELTA